jgi:hypothetical protein
MVRLVIHKESVVMTVLLDLPVPLLSNLNSISIKRTNPLMASSKPKQQSFDDDPWRVIASTPPTTSSFPDSFQQTETVERVIKTRGISTNPNPTSDNDPIKKTTVQTKLVPVDVITDKASTLALVKASTESYQWFLDLDQITVSVAEKEGFLFTHINYWVHSSQRQTSVRRRYSDFYWFWETLLKRYPFRMIPNLPPKKISGSKSIMYLH